MQNRVDAPALALMITGILNGIWYVYSMVSALLLGSKAFLTEKLWQQMPDLPATFMSGTLEVIFSLLWVFCSIFVVYGAIKMKSLENHPMAVMASFMAMIPCFVPCCFLWAIPSGIWAWNVLKDPDVKAGFKS